MNNEKLYSAREIWKENKIPWVKTYKTILRYISEDYKDVFDPITKGEGTGKRYFVKEENLNRFLKKFKNNELN